MDINLYEQFRDEIDITAIESHLRYFCGYEKLSGGDGALKTVEYIERELARYGLLCRVEEFPAYLSNPVSSRLLVAGEEIPSRPRSFSGACGDLGNDLEAELVFDPSTGDSQITEAEKGEFLKTVRGKLVVGYGFDERYGKTLEKHGAAGWIQVWRSDETLIHEDTVSPVWGTPDMDSQFLLMNMPVIGITSASGKMLIERIKEQARKQPAGLKAGLRVVMETGVKNVSLPWAEIGGAERDFVLLSCHYDTWYVGAFDNCAANAAALELARVIGLHQKDLARSVRIAWWPGHSNGRYMGSAWYCDHYYRDLRRHCVACLNSDLIGAGGTDVLAVRTTGVEGAAFLEGFKELGAPGTEIKYLPIGRGADQSFFGADIPFHINPRFETRDRQFDTPGAGGDYWHTAKDTYDKIDLGILEKDARILGLFTFAMAAKKALPCDVDGYFKRLDGYLRDMEAQAEKEFDLSKVRKMYERTRHAVEEALARAGQCGTGNAIIKKAFGTLNRLFQSSGSPYEQDTAFAYGPFHLLGESCRIRKDTSPADQYLFYGTTFVRQRNRVLSELENLIEYLEERGKNERTD